MGDDERIPFPGDVQDAIDVMVLGDLALGLQELALVDGHQNDNGQVIAEGRRIDHRDVAPDGPAGLQLLDAPDDRGRRRPQLFGDFAKTLAGIGIQGPDQLLVHGIDHERLPFFPQPDFSIDSIGVLGIDRRITFF